MLTPSMKLLQITFALETMQLCVTAMANGCNFQYIHSVTHFTTSTNVETAKGLRYHFFASQQPMANWHSCSAGEDTLAKVL